MRRSMSWRRGLERKGDGGANNTLAPDARVLPAYGQRLLALEIDYQQIYLTGPKYLSNQSRDSLMSSFLGT
jgi:hypothetical protein